MSLMTRARKETTFKPPEVIRTSGGLQVLVLDRNHLHFNNKRLPLTDITDASAFSEKVHPEYFYSDVVVMKDDPYAKVVKGCNYALLKMKYIHDYNVSEFINLLNHPSITKQLINL